MIRIVSNNERSGYNYLTSQSGYIWFRYVLLSDMLRVGVRNKRLYIYMNVCVCVSLFLLDAPFVDQHFLIFFFYSYIFFQYLFGFSLLLILKIVLFRFVFTFYICVMSFERNVNENVKCCSLHIQICAA